MVSDLLALALDQLREGRGAPRKKKIRWIAKPMAARVDLADTDALYDAMEGRRAGRRNRVAEGRGKRKQR